MVAVGHEEIIRFPLCPFDAAAAAPCFSGSRLGGPLYIARASFLPAKAHGTSKPDLYHLEVPLPDPFEWRHAQRGDDNGESAFHSGRPASAPLEAR